MIDTTLRLVKSVRSFVVITKWRVKHEKIRDEDCVRIRPGDVMLVAELQESPAGHKMHMIFFSNQVGYSWMGSHAWVHLN